MNEDLTKKLSRTTDDTLTLIFMAVQDLTFRAGMIEHKLEDFAEKAELRLQKVDSDFAQLREGQQGLQEGQESLRSDLTAFRRDVDKQFMTLSGTVEGQNANSPVLLANL